MAQVLSLSTRVADFPRAELHQEDALCYLHRETLQLSGNTPRGFVLMMYHGPSLGFVNNLGARANNLLPKQSGLSVIWRNCHALMYLFSVQIAKN